MERIIKTVSFFLKCQDSKDAIRELYDFIRFDYNPYHKNILIPILRNDFLLSIEVKQ